MTKPTKAKPSAPTHSDPVYDPAPDPLPPAPNPLTPAPSAKISPELQRIQTGIHIVRGLIDAMHTASAKARANDLGRLADTILQQTGPFKIAEIAYRDAARSLGYVI